MNYFFRKNNFSPLIVLRKQNMPRTSETTYTSHQDLLEEVKSMNTFRDYRQQGSGTFAQMKYTRSHKFPPKGLYQATTNSNESVVLEKKGRVFYTTSLDQKARS